MKKNLVQILILAPVSTSAMAGGSASVAGWFGEIIGGLIATILLPVVWLIACKIIPKLRRKISVSYGVAITLATFIFLFLAVFSCFWRQQDECPWSYWRTLRPRIAIL